VSRLFLRIFLWFWLGSTTLFLVLAVSFVMAQPDVVATWRFIGRSAMRYVGSHIADVYERHGVAAAAAAIDDIDHERRVRVWLYAIDGRLIAGATPAGNAADAIELARATSGDGERIVSRNASIAARRTTSDSGAEYVVMWEAPRSLRWYAQMSPMRFSMRVTAMIFTSGVVCWLLTWQITKPIERLRTAARRFADGDLAVRVGLHGELQRGDELSDLAGEFDRMAGRIQQLITSQQQLLADISHELRSPLARLALALDLARRRLGDDVPEHQRIEQEIQRLNGLIGQLLALARLQAPSEPPQRDRLNLGDLVREVAHDAQFEAEGSGRTVTLDGAHDIHVRANRALLRSALENVVRNAIRYTPPDRSVAIAMTTAGAPRLAAVAVRAHGPGGPAQLLPRLFDPFFRVDDARDRASGGIGLGLTIVRQAMIAHGGSASVQNHADGGLEVRLELPAVD
jgi:two-component system sensor histidine kinase CpxA